MDIETLAVEEGLTEEHIIRGMVGRDMTDRFPERTDHPIGDVTFAIEAEYLAQMCVNLILTLSPQRILLGGGVMQREALFPMVRARTQALLGGYVQSPAVLNHIDQMIVPPALYPVSGLVGSYLLGKRALLG